MNCIKKNPSLKKLPLLSEKTWPTTAEVINVSNSPLFSLRKLKITAIKKALSVLDNNNFINCILTSILNNSIKNKNIPPQKHSSFNKYSMLVANVAQSIAIFLKFSRKIKLNHNHVFMAGLFHNCAIPVLGANIPKYFNTIDNEMKKK